MWFVSCQVYQDSPRGCCQWLNGGLGYLYIPEEDGTVADWVISLVSVRFQNPESARHTRCLHLHMQCFKCSDFTCMASLL